MRVFLLLLMVSGCSSSPQSDNYFVGRVYDGASGQRFDNYRLDLQWFDRHYGATLDHGRFLVGPLYGHHDYTITIDVDGYRPFMSHNQMIGEPLGWSNTSFYFDAYLFPIAVKSPAASFRITQDDSEGKPSGTIRLRPISASSLYDLAAETPAGVPRQVWSNDEDLQLATVTKPIVDGNVQFGEGELFYGVTYQVSIFGIRDHQNLEATYRCGFEGDKSFVVPRLEQSPLELAFASTDLGVPSPGAEVVLVFNQDLIFDPLRSDASYVAALDAGFAISSPDENMNLMINTLRPAGQRAVTAEIAGNRMTLRWSRAAGLQTSDPADPIRTVTYGALNAVMLRPAKGALATSKSLQALVGAPSLTVTVTP